MLFVVSSLHNVSASFVFDALYRCMKVFRDFLGVLSEEAIRKNFILIYEIIDEMFDFGHPQSMTTESIKDYIASTPIVVKDSTGSGFKPSILQRNVVSSTAIQRTISSQKKSDKEEIFVDIFDKLTVLFNSNGAIINSSIDGVIQMKSYLKGNPELRLCLNENLVVGAGSAGYGVTAIDDCSFHECVDATDFEAMRTLTIQPPDGEFLVMNYRITAEF